MNEIWTEYEFLPDVLQVHDAFSIFDFGKNPTDYSSNELPVYCNFKLEIICEYYFGAHDERETILPVSGTDLNLD